jgi:hypothetical protein
VLDFCMLCMCKIYGLNNKKHINFTEYEQYYNSLKTLNYVCVSHKANHTFILTETCRPKSNALTSAKWISMNLLSPSRLPQTTDILRLPDSSVAAINDVRGANIYGESQD